VYFAGIPYRYLNLLGNFGIEWERMNNYRFQVNRPNMGPSFAFADAWGRNKWPGDVTPTAA
jgi:hypothetical protein